MKNLFMGLALPVLCTSVAAAQNAKPKSNVPSKTGTAQAAPKVVMKNLNDSFSYAAGVSIASNMKEQGIKNINTALVAKAMSDIFNNKPQAMDGGAANACLQKQLNLYNEEKANEDKKKASVELAKGRAFLAKNKERAGVTTLPSGLQYEIVTAGEANGEKPTLNDTVVVNYAGRLIDGTEFDSSEKNGGPVSFMLTQVIKGWTEILQLMPKGAHWKVYIPNELGYGERDMGPIIKGGAALVFDITLVDIKKPASK